MVPADGVLTIPLERDRFFACVSLEPSRPGSCFSRDCLEHAYGRQGFRWVIASTITSAVEGLDGVFPPK